MATKSRKPLGEIIVGLAITIAGVAMIVSSVSHWPITAWLLAIGVLALVIGLVVLLSRDATKTGDNVLSSIEAFVTSLR